MSQNVNIGLSFICMTKSGKILYLFSLLIFFYRFHKIKTRTYIKKLRHGSLKMNVLSGWVKFYA